MQHLGLVFVLLLVCGLAFTVYKWRGGLHMTFSQHAATNRSSKLFYSLLFLCTLPLLLVFFAGWLVPTKALPDVFVWFAVFSALFQIACTFVPEEGGRKTIIHRVLTAISGILLLPLMFILATAGTTSPFVKNTAWLGLVVMTALLVVALMYQRGSRYALLLQSAYYAVFFGVILVATYA